MMNNLFSSFDPSINMFNSWMNWLSVLIFLILIPSNFWMLKSKFFSMLMLPIKFMQTEAKILMNKSDNLNSIIYCSLFIILIINNFMGLFPYIFTGTSHMIMNFSLSIIMWSSIILFSVINKTEHLLAHLVPSGTPNQLMSFMVLIETISSLIRPIALSVRLTANMVAGHLLLTLIGSSSINSPITLISIILMAQMALIVLEMAVSLIQAYVFSILVILYASEI